jgi:seryl-tRNA synthetase
MAELDNIPQKQSIEIATVKLDDTTKTKLEQLNQKQNVLIADFGQIYLRKKEIAQELENLDSILEKSEAEFKLVADELKQTLEDLDEQYPQMRINLQEGVIQYQPGAPSRKQLASEAQQQTGNRFTSN